MRATGKLAVRLAAGLATIAGPACAEGVWAKLPTAAEIGAFYPDTTDGPRDGVVVLRCKVAKTGDLTDCAVVSETPAGAGFGRFALSLAPKFQASADGMRQMRGVATFPIRFSSGAEMPAPTERPVTFKSGGGYKKLGGPGPYFPERAARMGVSGVVVMDCLVLPDLRLSPCNTVSVTPDNLGFDDAARKMTQVGWARAGEIPPGATARPDGVWRFRIEFKAPRNYP